LLNLAIAATKAVAYGNYGRLSPNVHEKCMNSVSLSTMWVRLPGCFDVIAGQFWSKAIVREIVCKQASAVIRTLPSRAGGRY